MDGLSIWSHPLSDQEAAAFVNPIQDSRVAAAAGIAHNFLFDEGYPDGYLEGTNRTAHDSVGGVSAVVIGGLLNPETGISAGTTGTPANSGRMPVLHPQRLNRNTLGNLVSVPLRHLLSLPLSPMSRSWKDSMKARGTNILRPCLQNPKNRM
eukprot:TRINITY_DN7104_c0_g1_i1.p1 TRINITY_DN7104_c0_g1~~TRINITY_DN7104_c0_g1_i1.p1  ORF type:complete len:152 (+),score=0.96 TRINITY_DN7104_c0_g1_i1:111-566(+)